MQKVAILADSIACLPPEAVSKYQLQIIPLNIHFDGKLYRDREDITSAQAYQLLEKAPERFASSPASIGTYLAAYLAVPARTEGILCITLSAQLSTLNNVAKLAKEEASRSLPQVAIEVMDSQTAAVGEGLIVLAAAQAAAEGKSLAEVTRIAEGVKNKVHVIGIMDTVRYIHRTGRVPKITAVVGSILNIKPVFTITEGVVHIAGLARNRKQTIERALSIVRSKVGVRPVHVAVAHADAREEGEKLKERISAEFNCVELWLTDFSPIMAYATGPGVLAIAFYSGD